MRLPHRQYRPDRFLFWFAQPPRALERFLVIPVTALLIWSSRLPGESSWSFLISWYLWKCLAAGLLARFLARGLLRLTGERTRVKARERRWTLRAVALLVIALFAVLMQPLMIVSFWESRAKLDAVAQSVLAQDFVSAGDDNSRWVGAFHMDFALRCPHGVFISVDYDPRTRESSGFFYRSDPGDCSKNDLQMPLGNGWYLAHRNLGW
jgi:hypothetical protein